MPAFVQRRPISVFDMRTALLRLQAQPGGSAIAPSECGGILLNSKAEIRFYGMGCENTRAKALWATRLMPGDVTIFYGKSIITRNRSIRIFITANDHTFKKDAQLPIPLKLVFKIIASALCIVPDVILNRCKGKLQEAELLASDTNLEASFFAGFDYAKTCKKWARSPSNTLLNNYIDLTFNCNGCRRWLQFYYFDTPVTFWGFVTLLRGLENGNIILCSTCIQVAPPSVTSTQDWLRSESRAQFLAAGGT